MVLDGWLKGLLSPFPIRVKHRRPFHHAPAVIGTSFSQVNLLPEILAVLTNPDATRFCVRGDPPWISQPVGPRFRASICPIQKWIIRGNRIQTTFHVIVDVDPKDLGRQLSEVLAAKIRVGIARSIAAGDVQHPIIPEGQRSTVVAITGPLQNHLLINNLNTCRVVFELPPQDPRMLRPCNAFIETDKHVRPTRVLRMEA